MLDLVRPFSFLTIRHPSHMPLWVNWLLPLLVTMVAVGGLCLFGSTVNVFGPQGLIDRLLSFVQTLAGFFIAALAAVSSFNSPHLDREMPQPAPTMWVKYHGVAQKIHATRRRFLTSMFAYLTALSFLFSLTAIATLVLAEPIRSALPQAIAWLRILGLSGFLFALLQMTFVTFWGLFYLGERMLTPD